MPYSASFSWRCWRYMPSSSAALETLPRWRSSASLIVWRSKRSITRCFASLNEPVGASPRPSSPATRTDAGRSPSSITAPEAYRALCAHTWKGNVRELEHAIEQAVALASGSEIALGDLPASVRGMSSDGAADPPGSFREAKQQAVERFERQFIHEALARHHGNISKAAEDMGMYRQHLQLKLAEYGIDAAAYRER